MLTTARAADEMVAAVRFPVRVGRGIGFREVARRHGDFAIVALAAVAEKTAVRLAVAGMAGRPQVRIVCSNGSDALSETVQLWAGELEGYDDLHATAAMRRDLFRNLAPHVVADARTAMGQNER
jgi:2-furoyl-CoA dehydrogenase FAD binding subunit